MYLFLDCYIVGPCQKCKQTRSFKTLKTLRLATSRNDEIICSPKLLYQRRKKKNQPFHNINSARLSKITLSKNSGLGRIVLALIFFMDELSVHAALVVWYNFRSIYRQTLSAVESASSLVWFFRILTCK